METSSKTSKPGRQFIALLSASATLVIATLVSASTSTQVEQLANPLVVPRTGHAATVLSDGRVFLTGGRDAAGNIVAVSEIFDPATETSTGSATLTTPRFNHSATLLANGKVLVAGGNGASGPVNSAEIFDPANPSAGFQMVSATMSTARSGHTATLLSNGTVLIAGGDTAGTAEIFDPTAGTFSSAVLTLATPRTGHTATLFAGDNVLLAGGGTDSMEWFTSSDQKFTIDPANMSASRTGHFALELSDTRLLLFEGDAGNTIDEFNHSTDTITLNGTLDAPASSATLLANGNILVIRPGLVGLYSPDASAFTALDETLVPGITALQRSGQSATQLSGDKRIFVAGGVNAQNLFQGAALFNPARIWTDKDDYVPGDNVILSGSGWKPNENVYLYAVDSQTEAWTYGSTVAADANGGFVVNPYFVVQLVQQGANFSVSAVGAQSTLQANVKFTDAGSFSYVSNPSPASFTNPSGNSASFTESVTAPKGNGTFSATLIMKAGGTIPSSWLSLNTGAQSFVTGNASTGSPDTKTWTVTITAPSGQADGTYTGTVIADRTSNPNQGAGIAVTITLDHTAPAAPSTPTLHSGDDSGTNGDGITNVNTPHFDGTAEANSTVKIYDGPSVVGTGTAGNNGSYSVQTSVLSDATHSNITATATDAAGNESAHSGSTSVTIDTQRPSVTINQAGGQADPTSGSPINFTVAFNESVTGFTSAGVTITGTAGGTKTVVITGSGTTYNVAVSGMTTSGTVIATVGQNAARDTAANGNTASTSTDDSVTFNACTAPSISVDPVGATKSVGDSVTFSVTASGTSLSYQWRKNGSNIGGATSSSYTIASVAVGDAGSYDVVVSNSCGGATSNAAVLTVNKITPTINWSDPVDITYGTALSGTQLNATATYNSNPVAGTFTYTPAAGTVLNAGNNQVLSVDFTPTNTAAYNSVNGTTVHINVTPKTLTASIIGDPSRPYNGNTTATLTSANFSLSGLVGTENFTVTKTSGTYNSKDVATATTVTASLAAGDFTAVSGALASNYTLPTTASGPGHITKVTLTASIIGDPTRPYNGNTTATLTSANFSLSPLVGSENFTVTQTSGTYNSKDVATATTVTASLAAGNFTPTGGADAGNYTLPTTASGAGHITAVTLTASIVGNPTRPYNCGTTATLTSANFSLSGLVGTENFTVTQTAGTYNSKDVVAASMVTATLAAGDFMGTNGGIATNYVLPTTASGPAHIIPTDATISVTAYTSLTTKYNCNFHMATGTATGCDGDLSALFDFSGTRHKDAGDYPADSWTFNAGNTNPNYNSAGTTIHDSIAQADATITVTPYTSATTTYNCSPHTATGTATGCDGDLSSLLHLGGTTHTNAGDYPTDSWTFDGNNNYKSASGTVHDSIAKANATINGTPYNVTYDYNAHTATGTATGVCGENLLSATYGDTLDLSGTTHTLPGDYNDSWTFTDVTGNYNNASGTLDTLQLAHDIIHYGTCSGSDVILQPINADNSSVFPKSGRTVPVKFWVCDASGNSISNAAAVFAPTGATLSMLSAVRGTINGVNELGDTIDVPDSAFRFSSGQWIFNMATSNLQSGYTYKFRINLLYAPQDVFFTIAIK
jgi:Bacterial Ig-like domain/YDG domain/Immunoglobulin I-set domain